MISIKLIEYDLSNKFTKEKRRRLRTVGLADEMKKCLSLMGTRAFDFETKSGQRTVRFFTETPIADVSHHCLIGPYHKFLFTNMGYCEYLASAILIKSR